MQLFKSLNIKLSIGFLISLFSSLIGQNCDDTTDAANRGPVKATVAQFTKWTNRSDKLVLVYFSADWCIVCKKQKPILNEVKEEKKNSCEVISFDMECNPLIAEHFEVDALPVILIYKKGKLTFSQKGLITKTNLVATLQLYE
ncbi:MAG: thioredoxin family protein [bacterium]|nr:thioredoxin family protein [bacterium]